MSVDREVTGVRSAVNDWLSRWRAHAGTWLERLGWPKLDAVLDSIGDRLNPLLVKETRQALKSKQFALTFAAVLAAAWVATLGSAIVLGPAMYYAPSGGEMLIAYFSILAFPLLVIVPFMAFRSLAAEREDNTYDLLCVSTLTPHQVVFGKLGSSVVQMAVYLSAVTPCLAFTYMLRGVDVLTIAMFIALACAASVVLSILGILLATLSTNRFTQALLSIALAGCLFGTFWLSLLLAYELSRVGYRLWQEQDFWLALLVILTFAATTSALALEAAAARLTFASENRSTRLRVWMLIQQAALVGWVAIFSSFYSGWNTFELILLSPLVAACYWLAMGAIINGERSQISHRVQRRLPQSFLGRAFLTWFNPGPSTGYAFVVGNLTAVLILGMVGISIAVPYLSVPQRATVNLTLLLGGMVVGWAYVVAYLGVGRLLVAFIRKAAVVTLTGSFLIHFLLLLSGTGLPVVVQAMSRQFYGTDYSLLHVTNPIWSLAQFIDTRNWTYYSSTLIVLVPTVAVCVLLLNVPLLLREVRQVRQPLPKRVADDEAVLHPPPPPKIQANPWTEDEDLQAAIEN